MSIDGMAATGLERDLAELRAALARHPFPSPQDHILASLATRREPPRLLWLAAMLSRTHEYDSVDAVCADIARSADSGMPPPPGR